MSAFPCKKCTWLSSEEKKRETKQCVQGAHIETLVATGPTSSTGLISNFAFICTLCCEKVLKLVLDRLVCERVN